MNFEKRKARLAVGADGSGTTFRRILDACESGELNAEVAVLFTSKSEDIGAAEIARTHGVPVVFLTGTRDERTAQLSDSLMHRYGVIDLICLAGYVRLFPANLVGHFRGRILNSHPAIDLERFGGKGMYGTHVTEAEIEAGLSETGSTIHFVDEEYDTGKIVLQSRVPVIPGDSAASLLARKLPVERELYIQAIKKVLERE